jgi:hypothetical protein
MMGVVWRGAPKLHSHAARGNEKKAKELAKNL